MSASKVLAIGIATIVLGASGSPGAPATEQQPREITATATADAVTFVNTSKDGRFLIIRISSKPGEPPQVLQVAGEARIPATSSDVFVAYRLSAAYSINAKGTITDCKLAECPIPPPCPPPGQCPWATNVTFMKPPPLKTP